MTTAYSGRLVCDGVGGLYADDGEGLYDDSGNVRLQPVAFDPASDGYIFIPADSPNHNARFATAIAVIQGTTPDDAHDLSPTEDDPHFMPGAPNSTRITFDPDAVAPTVTGHTEAPR